MSPNAVALVSFLGVSVVIWVVRILCNRAFDLGFRHGAAHVRAEFAYEALKHVNNPSIQSIYEKASRQ